ncbi:MAG: ribosome biogenesis GTPase Der [Patescibacteria group bacterium]|nr:ribosome biogenesis GTPase Der [Patescibacteria group bacterium]
MIDRIEKNKPTFPLVVIFGRTNVGKSSLFNCLVEKRQALTSDIAGTTRDSNLGEVNWCGHEFSLIDTGGIIDFKHLTGKAALTDEISAQVQKQAVVYLKKADLVLFLLDGKSGLMPQDKELALLIKKAVVAGKILLVINKIDAPSDRLKTSEFYKLAMGEPNHVSAANGSGTGDLLDLIVKKLKFKKIPASSAEQKFDIQPPTSDAPMRVCIIGKPNVGKSSLLNSLLGYERVIVSLTPHTTREPQNTKIIYQDQPLLLIDTAGISKKGTKAFGLEKFGIAKSLFALAKSEIALLVLDISEPITRQDSRLAEEIVSAKKSFIIIANKWDLAKERDTKKYTDYIYNELPFARFAPIQFLSAKTGEKVKKIFDLILNISLERKIEVADEELKGFLKRIVKLHPPAKGKGIRYPRIRSFFQIEANPPKFEIEIGPKEDLHFSYIRFIENRLRDSYGFLGTPLSVQVTKNKATHGQHQD